MLKEKIIGTAGSFPELLRLLSLNGEGVIIITGIINCSQHEINLYQGMTLRGQDFNCGLKFDYSVFASTAIQMHTNSSLENIHLWVKTEKASRVNDHAVVAVYGKFVKLKNLTIDLEVKDDDIKSEKYYPAINLRYTAEATGVLRFNLHGRLATAFSGDSSHTAAIKFISAEVFINSLNSVRSIIRQCRVEIENSTLNYINESINPPKEEFLQAEVYFIGSTALNHHCLAKPKFEMENSEQKKLRLYMTNCLPLKQTIPIIHLKKFKFWPKK